MHPNEYFTKCAHCRQSVPSFEARVHQDTCRAFHAKLEPRSVEAAPRFSTIHQKQQQQPAGITPPPPAPPSLLLEGATEAEISGSNLVMAAGLHTLGTPVPRRGPEEGSHALQFMLSRAGASFKGPPAPMSLATAMVLKTATHDTSAQVLNLSGGPSRMEMPALPKPADASTTFASPFNTTAAHKRGSNASSVGTPRSVQSPVPLPVQPVRTTTTPPPSGGPAVCPSCHKVTGAGSTHMCDTVETKTSRLGRCVHCFRDFDIRFLEQHLTRCIKKHIHSANWPAKDGRMMRDGDKTKKGKKEIEYLDESCEEENETQGFQMNEQDEEAAAMVKEHGTNSSQNQHHGGGGVTELPDNYRIPVRFGTKEYSEALEDALAEKEMDRLRAKSIILAKPPLVASPHKQPSQKLQQHVSTTTSSRDSATSEDGGTPPTLSRKASGLELSQRSSSQNDAVQFAQTMEAKIRQQPERLRISDEIKREVRTCVLCEEIVPRSTFLQHLDVCKANVKSCPYCNGGIPICKMDEHVPQCEANTRDCYICGCRVQMERLPDHLQSCGSGGKIVTMFHGTSDQSAREILKHGFQPSTRGLLGAGVYVSRDKNKALHYGPVIVEAKVDIGKVALIGKKGHYLQKCWKSHGYDSAWIPANCGMVSSGLEEHCIYDPRRVAVVRITSAPVPTE